MTIGREPDPNKEAESARQTGIVFFVDTRPFWSYDYGQGHPLKIWRLRLTQALQEEYDLLSGSGKEGTSGGKGEAKKAYVVAPRPATYDELTVFHDEDYLAALEKANSGVWFPELGQHGVGTSDCPLITGVADASFLAAGGSIVAADKIVSREGSIAFHMAGGFHHAMPSFAWGFCYLNDPVVAIYRLKKRFSRIAYVDIDAHHGDGVQLAFYSDPSVLTISLHESGRYLFPGTGFETEMGQDEGLGFTLNVPFPPESGDDVYRHVLDEIFWVALERFQPEVIVSQLGVDTFRGDPLTHWQLTTFSFLEVVKGLKQMGLPWVALGGGGYDVANVCRGWTLALAVMLDRELPDQVPENWKPQARSYGVLLAHLKDRTPTTSPVWVQDAVRRTVRWLKSHHPLLTSGG
ncbi:MAG: acetoin utilization protein AcuC [Armatimonadetes bacterium]|nr:acetoin utilization protein AcuC [Armatimonadota bacterium]MDW8121119.1 acetoin utilization protein AcuC [Armatimonadota bacterium]